jgi:hypothetical protein
MVLIRMTVGRTFTLYGAVEGGVDLALVMTAALDAADLLVGTHAHDVSEARVVFDPVRADFRTTRHRVHLVIAVHRAFHARLEHALVVDGEQRVPLAAPDDLDDVPVCATEAAFEFLDDLAVAAHRAVEPLQIAVDDHDQIVEDVRVPQC